MGLQVAGTFGMVILIVINVVFAMLGLGLLIMGIVLRTSSEVMFEADVVDWLNEVSVYSSVGLGSLVTRLSIYVIILGVFMLVFGLIGSVAACIKNKILLIVYLILVIIMFINTCVSLGFWIFMSEQWEEDVRDQLYVSLEKYDGPDSEEPVSKGVDKVQIKLKCCGCNKVEKEKNPDEFKNSKWHKNKRKNNNEKVPPSCCKDATKDNYKTLNNPNCQEALEEESDTGVNEKGCKDAIEEEAESYELFVIIVGVIALVIEMVAIVFTILLILAVDAEPDLMMVAIVFTILLLAAISREDGLMV